MRRIFSNVKHVIYNIFKGDFVNKFIDAGKPEDNLHFIHLRDIFILPVVIKKC